MHCLIATCLLITLPFTTIRAEELPPQLEQPNDLAGLLLPPGNGNREVVNNASLTTPVPLKKEKPEYLKNCFYAEEELCAPKESNENQTNLVSTKLDVNQCQCKPHPEEVNSWYCCNITHMTQISTCNSSNWSNLHIRNASMTELDLSNSIFQTLNSLVITDGNLTRLIGAFNKMSSVKCLNTSNNSLLEISQRALGSAPNLKFLDISHNNLTSVPKLNQNQNISVYIANNKHMLCANLGEIISRDTFKFVESETSFCLMNNTYNWFKSSDYVSIKELILDARFRKECPRIPGIGSCECRRQQMIYMSDQSKLFCSVDCSNLGLTELPPKLPENTFSLNISNNNISSLGKHFHDNPTYWNIINLFADNNKISSINNLEGTKFMDQFQWIYLRNNAIDSLPVYLLTNVLSDTRVGRNILLGGNKLKCDCKTFRNLKPWLLERMRDIPDSGDIMCKDIRQSVVKLEEKQVCHTPHDWTDYIYYLIASEVLLLVALIAKVSYDYYVFKTAGYLPWPASKMPKLPCDWLCE